MWAGPVHAHIDRIQNDNSPFVIHTVNDEPDRAADYRIQSFMKPEPKSEVTETVGSGRSPFTAVSWSGAGQHYKYHYNQLSIRMLH